MNSLPRPARSASNPEVRQGSCEWLCHSWDAGSESSLVARSKKERHPCGCLSFLEQHFCYAKVVACGRVIEREWGNPTKVSLAHIPFLAVGGGALFCLRRVTFSPKSDEGIFRAPARVTFGRSPKSDQKVCLKPKVSRLPARYALWFSAACTTRSREFYFVVRSKGLSPRLRRCR